MALWRIFEKKRKEALQPESRWGLSLREDVVELAIPDRDSQHVALSELTGVIIETNDTGPLGADVWWLLFGKEDRVAVAFPQGASGEKEVIDALIKLPGFDHQAMIDAMGCATNQVFPVWRAPGL